MNNQTQHSLWSSLSDDEAQNFRGGFFGRIKGVARKVAPVVKKVAPIAGRIL